MIKYKTKYKYRRFKKEETVLQKGINGKKKIYTKVITNESGELVSTKVIKTEVIEEAISKVISTKNKKKVSK